MTEKKYSKDHEWVFIENEIATVGITNYAQESFGDIVFIDLPTNTGRCRGRARGSKSGTRWTRAVWIPL